MQQDAEELIVELTSGKGFEKYILSKGLNKEDGVVIQNQLLNDYYMNYIQKDSIEIRLNYIINSLAIKRHKTKKNVNELNPDEKYLIYLYNQDHTVMHCTNCRSPILYNDTYCYNCGKKTQYKSSSTVGYNQINKKDSAPEEPVMDNLNEKKLYTNTELEYAVYTFLDQIQKDTIFKDSDKFSDIVDNQTIIKQVLENNYAIQLLDQNNFHQRLSRLTIDEIKQLIFKHHLDGNGDKNSLINKLIQNIDSQTLNKDIPNKAFQITEKGLEILKEKPQIFFYNQFLKQYPLSKYNKYYLKNKNNYNIHQIGLSFVDNIRLEAARQLKWDVYRNSYLTDYLIYRHVKNKDKTILSLINVFVCDLNQWADNRYSLDGIIIAPFIKAMLVNAQKEYNFSDSELSRYFGRVCEDIKIPGFVVPQHDMYIYLKRTIDDEPIGNIKREIKTKLHCNPTDAYTFKNKYEQEKVYKKVKNCYY